MPAFAATAPGKIILFGEHAVVYGRPAIAVPVTQVRARAMVIATPSAPAGQVLIDAKDIHLHATIDQLPADHPLVITIQCIRETIGLTALPACKLQITSDIPIASGLGSGAAVSTAIARAIAGFLGYPLENEEASAIAYRVDQHYHGTPSGIDNTVIVYAQPIFFIRGHPFIHLPVNQPFTVVIGNTGISSPTGAVVNDVRRGWQANPIRYEKIFDEIASIARSGREIIENGPINEMGTLLTRNHVLLQELDVSSTALDRLVETSLNAGALGAKLCGGGRGGNMIALVTSETAEHVAKAMHSAGAVHTIITTVQS